MSRSKMTLEKFEEFMDSLTPLDRMNFTTLLSLPNAVETIAKLPEGKYRDAAVFGLALKTLVADEEGEGS